MIRGGSCICVAVLIALLSVSEAATHQVFVAADNKAALYVNGRLFSKTFEWQGFVQYDITLREGDVVAIDAKDLGAEWGAIAAVVPKGKKPCSTLIHKGPWRAVDYKLVGGSDKWKNKGYYSGWWPHPTAASIKAPAPGSALGFPYKYTGAQYVWAKGVGQNGRIALRLEIAKRCL